MSFRVSAVAAATAVLALSAFTPAGAQPVAPIRPRNTAFGNIFTPNSPANNIAQFQNQPFVNPLGPQAAGVGGFGQFAVPGAGYPGQYGYAPGLGGGLYGVNPQLPPTGVVGTFNNLGHWYGGGYGHWYPNGIANGRGVLGAGGGVGYGGGYAGGGIGPVVGGGAYGGRSGIGALGNGALTAGALYGTLRR